MDYNTFIHAVAAVNETLYKQAALQKVAGPKWNAFKTAMKTYYPVPLLGTGVGAGLGALYGGLSDDTGVLPAMGVGALTGLGLSGLGVGGYQLAKSRKWIRPWMPQQVSVGWTKAHPVGEYFARPLSQFNSPYLALGGLGALTGAALGGIGGDGWGDVALGTLGGAGLGLLGGYGANAIAKRNLRNRGWQSDWKHVLNPLA